jgi:hypothetical protein
MPIAGAVQWRIGLSKNFIFSRKKTKKGPNDIQPQHFVQKW